MMSVPARVRPENTRRSRRLLVLVGVLACGLLSGLPAAAGSAGALSVDVESLLAQPNLYAGQLVTIRGEVIGEVMYRGDRAWVNIGGQGSAVGVWVDAGLAREIQSCGSYGHTGDTVVVMGEFRIACPEHGGDPDIHALELHVVELGGKVQRPISQARWALGLGLLCVGFLLTLGGRHRAAP